eukprot:Nk52_evm14s160 gene=Nk52_evmTU14s160
MDRGSDSFPSASENEVSSSVRGLKPVKKEEAEKDALDFPHEKVSEHPESRTEAKPKNEGEKRKKIDNDKIKKAWRELAAERASGNQMAPEYSSLTTEQQQNLMLYQPSTPNNKELILSSGILQDLDEYQRLTRKCLDGLQMKKTMHHNGMSHQQNIEGLQGEEETHAEERQPRNLEERMRFINEALEKYLKWPLHHRNGKGRVSDVGDMGKVLELYERYFCAIQLYESRFFHLKNANKKKNDNSNAKKTDNKQGKKQEKPKEKKKENDWVFVLRQLDQLIHLRPLQEIKEVNSQSTPRRDGTSSSEYNAGKVLAYKEYQLYDQSPGMVLWGLQDSDEMSYRHAMVMDWYREGKVHDGLDALLFYVLKNLEQWMVTWRNGAAAVGGLKYSTTGDYERATVDVPFPNNRYDEHNSPLFNHKGRGPENDENGYVLKSKAYTDIDWGPSIVKNSKAGIITTKQPQRLHRRAYQRHHPAHRDGQLDAKKDRKHSDEICPSWAVCQCHIPTVRMMFGQAYADCKQGAQY